MQSAHPSWKYFGRELNWTHYYMCRRNLNYLLHIPDGCSALSLIMIQFMLHFTNSSLCHNFKNPGLNYPFLRWSQTLTHQLQRQWPLDALNQYHYSNITTTQNWGFCQAGSFLHVVADNDDRDDLRRCDFIVASPPVFEQLYTRTPTELFLRIYLPINCRW